MRNSAVVVGMTLIGLAVIAWVAWPDRDSSAVEQATPQTVVAQAQAQAPTGTSTDAPPSLPTRAPPSMPSSLTSTPIDTSASLTTSTAVANAESRDAAKAATLALRRCQEQCDKDNGQCNSEVRQNHQVCSKQAANGGNDPVSGRAEAYDYHCGYFDIAQCGSRDCAIRLSRRYAECVDFMRGSIMSRRFDCMRAQDEALSLCRTELRDCRAQCE